MGQSRERLLEMLSQASEMLMAYEVASEYHLRHSEAQTQEIRDLRNEILRALHDEDVSLGETLTQTG